ncbi:MAG: TrkH family potassium uptake protein [Clostridia bacterium]|nr:TrkH family potassium uptake protein [Clostridia bacterium]
MNYRIIRYVSGVIVLLEGLFLLFPALVSLVYAEYPDMGVFLGLAAVYTLFGFLMIRKKPQQQAFFAKEGFVMVALSWIVLSVLGALPFVLSGAIPSFTDALFETVSGFTTTGASILTDALPNGMLLRYGMLFWRSFTHWIGGMGVLVFMMALLPMAGGQGMYMMQAESTGPAVSKLVPSIRKTAALLYLIYFVMTVVQFVLLITVGKMPIFDAICSSMGTAGTGGFGVTSASFACYSTEAQAITTIFMVLFGINFNAYFLLLRRRFKEAFKMQEVRWYLFIYVGLTAVVIANLTAMGQLIGGDFWQTVHHAFFQTASVMTTTGYATVDFAVWPQAAMMLMCLLMFIGACAGSTGGGVKVSRLMLYVKYAASGFSRMLHPRRVKVLKMDGKAVGSDTFRALHVFLFCYVAIFIVSTIVLAFDSVGYDLETNATATLATLNNIGPGLGAVGPTGNFAAYSDVSKWMMCFNMLAGRLEIFPILLFFIPATWKK